VSGERQQVRLAVAAFFGGILVTDGEVKFQNGPLTAYGLGTAYPYTVRNAPDTDYTAGMPAGQNWGCVLSTTAMTRQTLREGYGGPTSGYRGRTYTVTCQIELIAETAHLETAGAGLDDLIDQMHAMVYADRNLGTMTADSVLILQAGEGRTGIRDTTEPMVLVNPDKGRSAGGATVTFDAFTMVEG